MSSFADLPDRSGDRPADRGPGWSFIHEVQFYDDEAYLCGGVARFLADGVRAGQPIVVIATASHRKQFAAQMRSLGVNPDHLGPSESVWLDTDQTLSAFMEGPHPSAELFEATVGSVFQRLFANRPRAVGRAYGELVDLLWRDGKSDGALELEGLWNRLARRYAFSLRCGYAKESFVAHPRADGVERICHYHSRVLPSSPRSAL